MSEIRVTCIICPIGCAVTVHGEEKNILSVHGNECRRGEDYARDEFLHPARVLTSTVGVSGAKEPLLPVRSKGPVPKELLLDCMEEIRKVFVQAPVRQYDVLIPDILGTGVDIVATTDTK